MKSGSTRPFALSHAGLASLLILTLALGGITIAPHAATAADAQPAKAKKEKPEKKDKKIKADSLEFQAREAFAAGRYQEALDSYAKLYAETLHPTYLRNVGRCYMNLDQPERATSSFREYLRKGKNVTDDERKEVDGFIAEMDRAQKKKDDAAAAAAATAAVKAKPADPTPPPAPIFVAQPATPPAPQPSPPFYAKGWFWGVVGGVVVVGVLGGLWAGGVFSPKSKCVNGYTCAPNN
jgi:tetratricopeptide (TPR) repeat protein